MKRKRGGGKRKPKKPPVVGANQPLSNFAQQHAQGHSNLNDVDAEFDSVMEAETQEARTNKSDHQRGLGKQVLVNERMKECGNSLQRSAIAVSGNLFKKAGSITTRSSRGTGSSSMNLSHIGVQLHGEATQIKEPRLPYQDDRYNEQELNAALLVIKKIMKMDAAEPFNAPVDPVAVGIPDYFEVIDTPMDFGTICYNLENGLKYLNSEDVIKDVRQIWENCSKYNKKGDYILDLMKRVKNNFLKYWTGAGLSIEQPQATSGNSHLAPPCDSTMRPSNCEHMCSMSNYAIYHQQDCQVQCHQCLPSYSHVSQPQWRACQCQSSSRELHSSFPQAAANTATAVDTMNGNPPQQQGKVNWNREWPQQLSSTCSHLYHPQQKSCQCQSCFSQQQPPQLESDENPGCAGHLHLPVHAEPAMGCSNHEHIWSVGPMAGHASSQQQCQRGSCENEAYHPLPRNNSLYHLHWRTCHCHLGSSHTQLSPPEAATTRGSAGHELTPSTPPTGSTMTHSKHGEKCIVDNFTDNSDHRQQQGKTDPSKVQSHHSTPMQSPRSPSQQTPCQGQQSSSPLQVGTNVGSADSTSRQRKTRGPTRCLEVWNNEGKHISVTFNELGQPIGLEAPKLSNFLGTLARNGHMAPLTYVDWRAMPHVSKENMWQQVLLKFDIDPKGKNWVLKSLGKKWKDWKSKLKAAHYDIHATDEERLADCDGRVLPDQWPVLISHWRSEEWEKRSAKNKANRAQQRFNHCTGTKSFARLREEQRAKRSDGKEPSQAELFILTRTRKNGQPVNEASSAVIVCPNSDLCKVQSKLREQATQGQETSPNSTGGDDIFSKVMGQDRHGCVQTYGLGPSPSNLGAPKPTTVEAMRMVSEANAEVHEMKEKMAAMEQTCTQMAAQMATMMSMMSAMQRPFPDKHLSNVVADSPSASEGSPNWQACSSPSRCLVPSYETRARKRGKKM